MEISPVALGRRFRNVGRLVQIVNVFAKHGLWPLVQRLGIPSWLTPDQIREAEALARAEGASEAGLQMPARIRRSLEELGPAFVKLGQILAVREDLLPPNFVEEFRKLHHNVAALPFSEIHAILRAELGETKMRRFETLVERPLAAGSIGQVHEAILKDRTRVVVKVQRPNIHGAIAGDLALMQDAALLVEKFFPESRSLRPTSIVAELTRTLLGELDFVREAGTTAKFKTNFAGTSHIQIPDVFWELSTSKVLTLSFIEGISAWDRERIVASGLTPSLLVDRGITAFLQMAFVDGFFHGDLHPGNILVLPENRVGFIDFGVAVQISRGVRERLAGFLMALVQEDYESMAVYVMEMSDIGPNFNSELFQHEIANTLAPYVGLQLSELRSGKHLWELAKIAARHDAPLPVELIVFLKTLATFEGIGVHLDPSFDVLGACQKFTKTMVKEMYSPEAIRRQGVLVARDLASLARYAPLQIRRLLRSAVDGSFTINTTSSDLRELAGAVDRSSSRLAVSVVVGALLVGSSILTYAKPDETAWLPTSMIGVSGFALAGVLGLYVVGSILRGRR